MPTTNEELIKEAQGLKDKIKSLENKKIEIMTEVNESGKIAKELIRQSTTLREEIGNLENVKNDLLSETKAADRKIRKEQQVEELNKRAADVGLEEQAIKERGEALKESEDKLEQQQKDLETTMKKMDDSRIKNEELNRDLNLTIKSVAQKESDLVEAIKKQNASVSSNTDLRNKLENQINFHTGKAREYDGLIRTNQNVKDAYRKKEEDLDARIKTANKNLAETQAKLDKAKEADNVANRRSRDAQTQRELYEKKVHDLKNQENNISLGWLKLNKRAKELRVEKEIENLKNA